METLVQLAFYKAKGDWVDWIVRKWTKSIYSHCEVVIGDTWFSSSPRDGGVRMKKIEYKPEDWDLVEYKGVSEVAVHELYRKTKGCKYDFVGILLSQWLPLGLQSQDKFYCSEWSASLLFPKTNISPGELYKLVSKG